MRENSGRVLQLGRKFLVKEHKSPHQLLECSHRMDDATHLIAEPTGTAVARVAVLFCLREAQEAGRLFWVRPSSKMVRARA
mgnify:CR=1 FL=1